MPDGTVFDSADRHYGDTESIRVYTFVKKIIEWAEKTRETEATAER